MHRVQIKTFIKNILTFSHMYTTRKTHSFFDALLVLRHHNVMLYKNLGHGVVFKIQILASEYNILDLFVIVRSHNVIMRSELN